METLGVQNLMRGTDAAGYAYFDDLDNLVVHKSKKTFGHLIIEDVWNDLKMPKVFIGHTRAATQGSPNQNENNHPLTSGNYTIVHNGIIWNDVELTKDHGLERNAEVDSEAIVSLISQMATKNPAKTIIKVLEEALPKVDGSHACAMLDNTNPNSLVLWKTGSPIHIAYSKELDTFFFSSMSVNIKDLELNNGIMDENKIYQISIGGGSIQFKAGEYESEQWSNHKFNKYYFQNVHRMSESLDTYGIQTDTFR